MKKALYLCCVLCISICCFTLFACSNASDIAVKKRFPSTFLEVGNDDNHSYVSLKSSRLDNDHLQLEVTGWGIEQSGMFLNDNIEGDALVVAVMGECGTFSPPPMWQKRTYVYTVSNTLEDSLNFIRLRAIELGKQ